MSALSPPPDELSPFVPQAEIEELQVGRVLQAPPSPAPVLRLLRGREEPVRREAGRDTLLRPGTRDRQDRRGEDGRV